MPFAAPGQTIVTMGGRRVVVGSPAGAAPLVADILLDFVNSIYRVDGTTYASAAAAGFAGTGTFDANGYTATGTEKIAGTVALPGNFVVLGEFTQPSTGAFRMLWAHPAGGAGGQVFRGATGNYGVSGIFGSPTNTSASSTRIAFGYQSTATKLCFDNGSVFTGSPTSAPGLTGAFTIGNYSDETVPFTAPIKKIAIYKQTLTDAQIQALT